MDTRSKQEKVFELEKRLWHYITLELCDAVEKTKEKIKKLKEEIIKEERKKNGNN